MVYAVIFVFSLLHKVTTFGGLVGLPSWPSAVVATSTTLVAASSAVVAASARCGGRLIRRLGCLRRPPWWPPLPAPSAYVLVDRDAL